MTTTTIYNHPDGHQIVVGDGLLTGKAHFNVLVDVRKMLSELGEDELKFQGIYRDSMTTTTIYNHPDGHQIVVGDGLLTACTADGFALSMPIGPDGMEALGRELIERASGEKHNAAERAGGALARTAQLAG